MQDPFYFFYCSFLLLQKRTKKGAPKSITARFREAAMFDFCTTVASAVVILLLELCSMQNSIAIAPIRINRLTD